MSRIILFTVILIMLAGCGKDEPVNNNNIDNTEKFYLEFDSIEYQINEVLATRKTHNNSYIYKLYFVNGSISYDEHLSKIIGNGTGIDFKIYTSSANDFFFSSAELDSLINYENGEIIEAKFRKNYDYFQNDNSNTTKFLNGNCTMSMKNTKYNIKAEFYTTNGKKGKIDFSGDIKIVEL